MNTQGAVVASKSNSKKHTGTAGETVKERRSLGKRARACREQKIGAD